jgi:DNA-binding beta-propeller fold protein YncE
MDCMSASSASSEAAPAKDSARLRDVHTTALRLRRRWIAALCLMVGALLLWSSPALALSQRGHVFGFSFGTEGAGEGQFSGPSGVGVHELNATSEEVYVADHAHNRVERFKCTISATERACMFLAQAEVPSPEGVAVDNSAGPSSGDVYVVAKGVKNAVYKFRPAGEKALEKVVVLKGTKEKGGSLEPFEALHGVAVDANGGLWIYQGESEGVPEEGVIHSFSGDEKNKFLSSRPSLACGPRSGFAVSALAESFYVAHQNVNADGECPEAEAGSQPTVIAKLNGLGEELISAVDHENSSAATVDLSSGAPSSGNLYIDNVTTVAAFNSGGALVQRFGAGDLTAGSGVAVDSNTGAVFVADFKVNRVDVFTLEPPGAPTVDSVSSRNITPTSTELSAAIDPHGIDAHYYFQYGTVDCKTSPSSCTVLPAPPPGADLKSGSEFGARTVSVQLMNLQPGTTYFYRVVVENLKGETAEGSQKLNTFTTVPSAIGLLADGRMWEMVSPPDKSAASIEAIPASEGVIQASADGSAVTYLANGPLGREVQGNRAPERPQILSTRGSSEWSSQDLNTPTETAAGLALGQASEYQFFSSSLALAVLTPFGTTPAAHPPLAPETPENTVYLRDNPPVSPAESEQGPFAEAEKNRAFLSPGYVALVSAADVPPGTKYEPAPTKGEAVEAGTATPDLRHVVISSGGSGIALTSEPAGPQENLYEWSAGKAPSEQLQLVSVLPNKQPATNSLLGGREVNLRHAISTDGRRVFWSSEPAENVGEHLYMRDMAKRETIQIDAPAAGVKAPAEGEQKALFQAASSDGSRVFFTSTQPLTKDATAHLETAIAPETADLYVCNVVEKEEKPACNLEDLTAKVARPGDETADVQGVVLGAGEDGSYVYFMANGVLADGASHGSCIVKQAEGEAAPAGAACSLYVEHYDSGAEKWESPTFIARLSNEDGRDWEEATGPFPDLKQQPTETSPSGSFLAFMSQQRLTPYDNTDQNSGKPNEEVYLYDATANRIVCTSCNPNGAPPAGVFDGGKFTHIGEGSGLLVDRQGLWEGHYLAGSVPGSWAAVNQKRGSHQYRYLSDSGRMFFNSPVQLVAADKNAKEDVYQYEPAGVGSCTSQPGCVSLISSGTSSRESAFLDASANGNDVFFLTSAQLLPQDGDTSFDVYDASVCSTSGTAPCLTPPTPPAPPCTRTEECRPGATSQPAYTPPASSTVGPSGNLAQQGTLPEKVVKSKPLTRAQKLAKALKSCKKLKKKSKRHACEKQARKRYGSKAKAKKASGHSRKGKR